MTPQPSIIESLKEAEQIALQLFQTIQQKNLIKAGKSENQLNEEIFDIATQEFGIKKYWHKRIVRAGKNTLRPYNENPENLIIASDDIVFFDFGPIIEQWEADLGRTYVLGNNLNKLKLAKDVELLWQQCRYWYFNNLGTTGAEFFDYIVAQAKEMGWTFGGEIAGHLVGQFPHEKLGDGIKDHYVHPKNFKPMNTPGSNGQPRNWILEIHLVDKENEIGGFFEQLLIQE